jgi:hypothetical protein
VNDPVQHPTVPPAPAAGGGNNGNGNGDDGYVAYYRHYKTGKLMIPSEYGYKAWRFRKKKGKNNKKK